MLFQSRVTSCFIFSDQTPLVYILNPKSGCSTVLGYMWQVVDNLRDTQTFSGDPHGAGPWQRIADMPAESVDAVVARSTFSIVRNPFARALSGYLSKIGERSQQDLFVWRQFQDRFGLPDNAVPTFDEYLEMIEREPVEMMDPHWSPQYFNLLQPVARIDHLFYLENMLPAVEYLQQHLSGRMMRSNIGFRDARTRLDHFYTQSAIDRVSHIYAMDFEMLGYSQDITLQRAVKPIASLEGRPEGLSPMLKHMATKDWQEKLAHLDHFERLNGVDAATAMARFCCGGEEQSRMRAAESVLLSSPKNWLVLREIAAMFTAHGQHEKAARFAAAAESVHQAIRWRKHEMASSGDPGPAIDSP
ncbi:sulfotransferase family 2 domain-containing protein [Sphingomonas sp. YR710]|uniref:sulfotransferase family 2 domain-containing protein n=1 Tax=Sphingomonas sp. YR710 TaxID=1882773 RepID=UPI00210F1372|nr:sulfotransferase family 2 domain-containing protein [Sphingomonas sp. YR710]